MNNIFAHFISRGNNSEDMKRLDYAIWFVDAIPKVEFSGDELLFYSFLGYCSELGIPITYKYLQTWIATELRSILHKERVKVTGCENLNLDDPASFETLFQTTSNVLSDDFRVLETIESDVDDFKIEVASYFNQRKKERLTEALANTFETLNATDDSELAASSALDTMSSINDIYDITKLEDLTSSNNSSNTDVLMEFVSDSGLPAIDNDSLGIRSTQLFGVEAQPGTGKTRFVLGTYVYRALTIYKKSVLFFALEQHDKEIYAMLVAKHTYVMFNIQITSKMILTGTVPDEYKAQVEAARYDLFDSGKYGKFVVKETTLYVETFISKIRTLDRLQGPFDLIVIDYMGLIESDPPQYQKVLDDYKIIKMSFKLFKRYLRHSRKAGIAISQLNREGIAAGENDKKITPEMAQGGLAVYQNTDYNISMTATDTMKLQQKRRLSQPKVRDSAGFPRFMIDVRLGILFFRQAVQNKV